MCLARRASRLRLGSTSLRLARPQRSGSAKSAKSMFPSMLPSRSTPNMDLPTGLAKALSSKRGAFSELSFRLTGAPKLPLKCRRKCHTQLPSGQTSLQSRPTTKHCKFCDPTPTFQLRRFARRSQTWRGCSSRRAPRLGLARGPAGCGGCGRCAGGIRQGASRAPG